jgi:hypothetical protein
VKLQVEKTTGARVMYRGDGGWSRGGEELEADLEDTDGVAGLVDESSRVVKFRNVERKCDVRLCLVPTHESPQQRYGAD